MEIAKVFSDLVSQVHSSNRVFLGIPLMSDRIIAIFKEAEVSLMPLLLNKHWFFFSQEEKAFRKMLCVFLSRVVLWIALKTRFFTEF